MCKLKFEGGIVFRCLEDFNLALLAKQGWRLLHSKFLFYRILKLNIFPVLLSLILLGHNHSYAGRVISQAKWILQQGCKWRVSNGQQINIWKDCWQDDVILYTAGGNLPYDSTVICLNRWLHLSMG